MISFALRIEFASARCMEMFAGKDSREICEWHIRDPSGSLVRRRRDELSRAR